MVSGTHTPCGRAPAPTTNSARTCASTSQVPWPRSPIPAAASCAPKPAPSWPPPPHRLPPARSPSPSCGPCSARAGAAAHRHRSRPAACEQAMGRQALALLRHLDAACASAADLEHAAAESFKPAPGRRDHHQLPRARPAHRPGYSPRSATTDPASPTPKGSRPRPKPPHHSRQRQNHGRLHRRVKNQRLAAVGYNWAFSAITASPGARAHYDRRKQDGDRHAAAQRNLFGRLLGWPPPLRAHRPARRRNHRLPRDQPERKDTKCSRLTT